MFNCNRAFGSDNNLSKYIQPITHILIVWSRNYNNLLAWFLALITCNTSKLPFLIIRAFLMYISIFRYLFRIFLGFQPNLIYFPYFPYSIFLNIFIYWWFLQTFSIQLFFFPVVALWFAAFCLSFLGSILAYKFIFKFR